MRPHFSELLANLRADLTQNPSTEEELNLLELVYLDALRAHTHAAAHSRLARLQAAQNEALAAADAVWQSQTALLVAQRSAAEAARAAAHAEAQAEAEAQLLAQTNLGTPSEMNFSAAPSSTEQPAPSYASTDAPSDSLEMDFFAETAPAAPEVPAPAAPEIPAFAAPDVPAAVPSDTFQAPTPAAVHEDDKLWAYAKAAAQAAKNVLAGFPDGPVDEPAPQAAAPVMPQPAASVAPAPEPVTPAPVAYEPVAPTPVYAEPVAATPVAPAPAAAESAAPAASETVASKAASGQPKGKSLNARFSNFSLGLNDRLAFSKHLFNDNPEDLARVVNQLNTLESFEESVDFIENMVKPEYDWSAKQDYEERFLNLIRLRFE
jgi:hypothetical protein